MTNETRIIRVQSCADCDKKQQRAIEGVEFYCPLVDDIVNLHVEDKTIHLNCPLDKLSIIDCIINPIVSRVCERGTKSCKVHHNKAEDMIAPIKKVMEEAKDWYIVGKPVKDYSVDYILSNYMKLQEAIKETINNFNQEKGESNGSKSE